MTRPEDLITDKAIEIAFGNADFGTERTKREIVANALLKCACGYSTGSTARYILKQLGLVTSELELSAIGKEYLWATYK